MAKMRDVARLAGVSVATVSAVINNKGCVSPKLTQQVIKALDALDYEPNQVARSLRIGYTNVIGMIVPDVTNPFYTEIMRGVEEVAQSEGYSVTLCDSDEDPAREEEYLATLRARRVDGVLLASSVSRGPYDRILRRQFPIVFVDAVPAGITEGVVTVDNVAGAHMATRHLIGLGHRRIAIITGNLTRSVAADRLEGFRKGMDNADLPVPAQYIKRGDFHMESGYRCGLELMRLDSPPTAVFVCNNRMTLGLMRALASVGVPCPKGISVVCFDDADWATAFSPTMTCVAQPTFDIGRQATKLLLGKIGLTRNDGSERPLRGLTLLEAKLLIRESTAPPSPMSSSSVSPGRGTTRPPATA